MDNFANWFMSTNKYVRFILTMVLGVLLITSAVYIGASGKFLWAFLVLVVGGASYLFGRLLLYILSYYTDNQDFVDHTKDPLP